MLLVITQTTLYLVSCGEPSIKNASVVLHKANGTFYMDTATVTCDAWYQTRNNTITCQISGEWETMICEGIGIYVVFSICYNLKVKCSSFHILKIEKKTTTKK
jgi:hypothetical protein